MSRQARSQKEDIAGDTSERYDSAMSLAEIKELATQLPPEELTALTAFLVKRDQSAWDDQMEKDAASGELDRLSKRQRASAQTVHSATGPIEIQSHRALLEALRRALRRAPQLARKNYQLWQKRILDSRRRSLPRHRTKDRWRRRVGLDRLARGLQQTLSPDCRLKD